MSPYISCCHDQVFVRIDPWRKPHPQPTHPLIVSALRPDPSEICRRGPGIGGVRISLTFRIPNLPGRCCHRPFSEQFHQRLFNRSNTRQYRYRNCIFFCCVVMSLQQQVGYQKSRISRDSANSGPGFPVPEIWRGDSHVPMQFPTSPMRAIDSRILPARG